MVLKPMVRNNICMNAHPAGLAYNVDQQIEYVKKNGEISGAAKKVLIIGGSTGFGLSTRIVSAFGNGAGTINVSFEKMSTGKRPASVGYYNSEHFDKRAKEAGLVAENIYGDAFSHEIKDQTIAKVKELFGKVDLVVYSLASGVRPDPNTGELYKSVLKPIGSTYTAKGVNTSNGEIVEMSIDPATEEEVANTVKVMGGEDWTLWIEALKKADVLEKGAVTVAYSYIGPEVTSKVYREGSIGKAKEDLEATAHKLTDAMSDIDGKAFVSVNKALVTRASAVIPVLPLYIAILFKVMKKAGNHEGCIEQIYRLYKDRLYTGGEVPVDSEGRIRIDDWEMQDDIQAAVTEAWNKATTENLPELADLDDFNAEFLKVHGFGFDAIDYDADVEI